MSIGFFADDPADAIESHLGEIDACSRAHGCAISVSARDHGMVRGVVSDTMGIHGLFAVTADMVYFQRGVSGYCVTMVPAMAEAVRAMQDAGITSKHPETAVDIQFLECHDSITAAFLPAFVLPVFGATASNNLRLH